MPTGRTEAFSDGVFAIIITIMVLELAAPEGAGWRDLIALWPKMLIYLASFVYIGLHWINHHHLFHAVERVSGAALWANLGLLFLLSLFPLATAWVGEHRFAPAPISFYAAVTLASALASAGLVRTLRHANPGRAALVPTSSRRFQISIGAYAAATLLPVAFGGVGAVIAAILLVVAAALWVLPRPGGATPGAAIAIAPTDPSTGP